MEKVYKNYEIAVSEVSDRVHIDTMSQNKLWTLG